MLTNAPQQPSSAGWRNTFRALRYRNYRLFFSGQGVSLIGTWIQQIALSWLVYRLTGSAFLLGLVTFASTIPTFLLSPLAGVVADRMNRRSILYVTQALFMSRSLFLALLTLTDWIQVWQILPLAVFLGLVNAFDVSTRQSFVIDLVEDRKDLGNAIALNSLMFNGARMIGPSLAGILVSLVGEGWCFLLDGVSYIAVIGALVAMRIPPREKDDPRKRHILEEMREGFRYTYHTAPIRDTILFLGLVSLMGMPYTVLMPVFAGSVLHESSATFGFLMAGVGFGALGGALFLASRQTVLGLGGWIVRAGFIFGFGLIAFSLSRSAPLSFFLLIVVGFGMMVQMAASNTVLQTIVEDSMRGRVMGFYAMAFMGMTPFGSLLSGFLADRIGVPDTIAISGAACIAGALVFARRLPALRKDVRPIYRRMGIIPGEDASYPCPEDANGETAPGENHECQDPASRR